MIQRTEGTREQYELVKDLCQKYNVIDYRLEEQHMLRCDIISGYSYEVPMNSYPTNTHYESVVSLKIPLNSLVHLAEQLNMIDTSKMCYSAREAFEQFMIINRLGR